jgi:hypothetical protein
MSDGLSSHAIGVRRASRPMEYALELNRLIQLKMVGSIGERLP